MQAEVGLVLGSYPGTWSIFLLTFLSFSWSCLGSSMEIIILLCKLILFNFFYKYNFFLFISNSCLLSYAYSRPLLSFLRLCLEDLMLLNFSKNLLLEGKIVSFSSGYARVWTYSGRGRLYRADLITWNRYLNLLDWSLGYLVCYTLAS